MPKVAFEAELLGAGDLARSALHEVTEAATVGDIVGYEFDESGAVTLFFACNLPGYPGWRWAASLAKVAKDAPVTVLEVELLPGEGALLSPDWVPWSVRLAQFSESQAALEAENRLAALALAELAEDELDDDDEDDELDDDLDDDSLDDEFDDEDDDDDDDDDDILVSDFDGEIDGIDIDAIADEVAMHNASAATPEDDEAER
jgi:hypothetical protein